MDVTVISAGGEVTRSREQVEAMSRDVATRLVLRGLAPGSRLAVGGDTRLENVVLARAALEAGFQITFLGPGGGAQEEKLRGLHADVIVAPADELDPVPGRGPGRWIAVEELMDLDTGGRPHGGRTISAGADFEPERFRLVQFTSGTTDEPRPLTVNREALVTNLEAIRTRLDMSAEDSIFSWLPLNHDMGLVGSVLLAEHLKCDLTLCAPAFFLRQPSMWPEWLTKARPSFLPAPNSGWSILLRRAEVHELTAMRHSLASLRLAVIGGEPIDPSLCERLISGNFAFIPDGSLIPAYGLAEATVGVTAAVPGGEPVTARVPGTAYQEVMSVGPALNGVSVTIRERGNALPDGEIGEISVHGESLADEFRGGLATGDEGFLIGSELFVTGRRKDLIKVRGRRVFPHEIERIAEMSGLVRPGRAVAFSIPEPPAERVVLLVEPSGRGDDAEDRLCRLVQRDLGVRLDTVGVVGRGFIPKTTSGKLQRGEARSRWLSAEKAGGAG